MVMMGLCTPEAHDALLLTLAEELSPKGTFSAALTAMSFKSDRDKGELVHALTALRGKQRGPHAANAIESAISLRTVLRDKPPRQHQPPADSTAGRRAEQLVSC